MKALRQWSLQHADWMASLYHRAAGWAPRLAPLLRLLGPRRAEAWLRAIESRAKGALFDCRMCGDCALLVSGMACPMGCGKQMRNGPCGGVRADGSCELDPQRRCTWVEATEGDQRIAPGHGASWTRRVPPLDQRRRGQSSWIRVIDARDPAPQRAPTASPVAATAATAAEGPSAFELACQRAMNGGPPVVTVEITPPDSADPGALLARAARFAGLVDAINITDGAGANCHMSSVAAASVLVARGIGVVCQVGCRDRNRIAVQGDVLGAAALGVRNVLCLTGDDVSQGDHPQAKPVFDLDAVNLLHILRGMRDQAAYASGRRIDAPPRLFLGATANPFVPPFAERVANLERKIDAGAQFIQTQFCFDLERLQDFMHAVRQRGLHRRAAILVGVGTLSSAKALRWMAEHVPGVHVPLAVTDRMAAAPDPREEGLRQCIQTLQAALRIEGVAGIHLMGHRNEQTLARAIVESGLRQPTTPVPETTT